MNNLRLLLLEDLDEEAFEVIEFLEDNDYEVVRVKNSEEALKEIKNSFFDIIILDIMIDGKPEGIFLAHRLNHQGVNVPFLFLTSMQSKQVFEDAKLTNPYTYLLKPFNKLELLYSLELALEKFHEQTNSISLSSKNAIVSSSYLFVKDKKSIVKIDTASIICAEVEDKYLKLITQRGDYFLRVSLNKVKELLNQSIFLQTHRSYLINVKKIKEIYPDDNLLIMEGDYKIPFSERHKNQFMKDIDVLK